MGLSHKIIKILEIFKHKLDSVQIVCSDMDIIGVRYKQYYIKDGALWRPAQYLNMPKNTAYSYGGLLKKVFTKEQRSQIKQELPESLGALFRQHYYQNRIEVHTLLPENMSGGSLVSLDFRDFFSTIMGGLLPIRPRQPISKQEYRGGVLGFYFIRFRSTFKEEPILPIGKEGQTYFCHGLGEGVYGCKEIAYFKATGGVILYSELLGEFDEECYTLTPSLERVKKLPCKQTRKQLVNQLFGHFGMRPGKYKKSLQTTIGLEIASPNIRRLRQYGTATLVETYEIEKINNPVENLAGSLIITALGRIQLHQLICRAKDLGVVIYSIHTDELIVQKNALVEQLCAQHPNRLRLKPLATLKYEHLKTVQFEYLHKRRRQGPGAAAYAAGETSH